MQTTNLLKQHLNTQPKTKARYMSIAKICSQIVAHVYFITPSIVIRTRDDVWGIVFRFLTWARSLSLLEHVQSACVDPCSHLSTASPTRGYIPVGKAAGTRSWPLSSSKILKAQTALPLKLHGPQINNSHTNGTDVTRSNDRYSSGNGSSLSRSTKHHNSHLRHPL